MKIQKLAPLSCPQCKSTNAYKSGSAICCHTCMKRTDNKGRVELIDGQPKSKGYDPRFDTDDYLEGWITQKD